MLELESGLADAVLFEVVVSAEADRPLVRWLEPDAAIGPDPNMRTFDRSALAARHAAVMLADPVAVGGAAARLAYLCRLAYLTREHEPRH